MKALIAQKEFNGFLVGGIIGTCEQVPNNHHVNDGFIVAVDIPGGLSGKSIKSSYVFTPRKWTKSGQADRTSQPTREVNQPIIEADDSWTHIPAQAYRPQHWTKDGFATQYDQPPLVIVNGVEVADDSWTAYAESAASPEAWTKNSMFVTTQPTVGVDNFVTVPDDSWTLQPEQYSWTISEDAEASAAQLESKKVDKYVRRIQYADVIIAQIARRNESKTLTVPQIIEMNTVYGQVMQLLKSGSYDSARSIIMAATPSAGITQQDIDYVVSLIENHVAGEL